VPIARRPGSRTWDRALQRPTATSRPATSRPSSRARYIGPGCDRPTGYGEDLRKNHYGSHSLRGTEVAGTLYSLVESAKLNDVEPRLYLRVAVRAGLRHETVPLPHEVKALLAEGKLDPADYDDHTEEIVNAAIAAAQIEAARAGRRPDKPDRDATEAVEPPTA
jgi:hypothetical protein